MIGKLDERTSTVAFGPTRFDWHYSNLCPLSFILFPSESYSYFANSFEKRPGIENRTPQTTPFIRR